MQTIGERLEEARKRKGISIREAAEHTKIRGDYLQKFEANSFEIDLPPLYIRGFVRTYARYLELDAERVVSEVDAGLARDGKTQRREHREPLGRVEFGSEGRKSDSGEGPTTTGGKVANDKAMLLKFGVLAGGALIAITLIILLINLLFSRTPTKPVTPSAAVPVPQVAGPRENNLTLTAKGAVRVKVARVANEEVLLDGRVPLNEGESRIIRYTDKIKVTVDDPSKLAMELNGRRVDVPIQQYGYFFIEP